MTARGDGLSAEVFPAQEPAATTGSMIPFEARIGLEPARIEKGQKWGALVVLMPWVGRLWLVGSELSDGTVIDLTVRPESHIRSRGYQGVSASYSLELSRSGCLR